MSRETCCVWTLKVIINSVIEGYIQVYIMFYEGFFRNLCSANRVNSETKFFYKENVDFLPKIVCFFIKFTLVHLAMCNPSEQTNE